MDLSKKICIQGDLSQGPIICNNCIQSCKAMGKSHDQCVEICVHCSGGARGGQGDASKSRSDGPDGPDDDEVPYDDDK